MKSFKDFIKEKPKQMPFLETVFGKHSQEKKEPVLQTTFGKHSQEKLKEEAENKDIGVHSNADEYKIHEHNRVESNNAARKYAMSSAEMNGTLHTLHGGTAKPVSDSTINNNKKHIKDLDDVLNKSKIHADTHVFTGLPHSPEKHFKEMNAKKGESITIHHPAYLSTTTDYDTAKFFASRPGTNKAGTGEKHVLKIHLPQGTKGGSIKHLASFPEENEVLLHRGHNIEIHPHPTIDKDGTHVWHAKVVSHTPKHIED